MMRWAGISGLSGNLTTRYSYDPMNRLTTVVQLTNGTQSATAAYGYHAQGQMNLKTYGNGDTVLMTRQLGDEDTLS